MKTSSLKNICAALDRHHVRFLLAGGLAVIAHGYLRFTKDADIAIELVPENIERAFAALIEAGYAPTVPITARDFSDALQRDAWVREKNMTVLQFWSDKHRETPVDLFVTLPFDFSTEYAGSMQKELMEVGVVHIVTLPTLIRMKEAVGREQDMIDVRELRRMHESKNE